MMTFRYRKPPRFSMSGRFNSSDVTLNEIIMLSESGSDTLDLSGCHLESIDTVALALIFTNLPKNITTLILKFNNLSSKSTAELILMLGSIPASVRTLDLSYINLQNNHNNIEKVHILSAIPDTVTKLVLKGNDLFHFAHDITSVVAFLRAISITVTDLDLSSNSFENASTEETVEILRELPENVTHLSLNNCDLFASCYMAPRRNVTEMMNIMSAIQPSVAVVNLSDNKFEKYSGAELKQIFQAASNNLKIINFGDDSRYRYHIPLISPSDLMMCGFYLNFKMTEYVRHNILYNRNNLFEIKKRVTAFAAKCRSSNNTSIPIEIFVETLAKYLTPCDLANLHKLCTERDASRVLLNEPHSDTTTTTTTAEDYIYDTPPQKYSFKKQRFY